MYLLISLLCAIIPALFLVVYFYRMDKARPEPKKVVIKIFVIGMLSTIPAIILELLIGKLEFLVAWSPVIAVFFDAFIVASLCEEAIKLFVVKQFAFKNTAFDEAADGVVYTVIASLGFACLENILYVLDGGITVALMRAFTSVPLHATASGIMGFYIGKAKFAEAGRAQRSLIFKGFMIAFIIHGYYDFVIMGMDIFGVIPALTIIPLLIIAFIRLRRMMKTAVSADKAAGRTV